MDAAAARAVELAKVDALPGAQNHTALFHRHAHGAAYKAGLSLIRKALMCWR
jgi:hypothetical protein